MSVDPLQVYEDEAKRSEGDKSDEAMADMESQLQRVKDQRNEDRFIGLLIGVIFLDAHFFSGMNSWGGPVSIMALELVCLIILARRLGIDDVEGLMDRILHGLGKSKDTEGSRPTKDS